MAVPEVPYVSQRNNTPRNDCGPACCLMLARWNGRAESVAVADWAGKYDPEDNGTTGYQLETILRVEVALHPTSDQSSYPHILLVEYNRLPARNRSDQSGRTFKHWITRLSDTTYHDPYHFGNNGANLHAAKATLDAAMVGTGARIGVTERPTEEGDMSKWKAQSDGARVRTTTDTTSTTNIVGVIPGGAVFPGDDPVNNWIPIKLKPERVTMDDGNIVLNPTAVSLTFTAYVSVNVATEVTTTGAVEFDVNPKA